MRGITYAGETVVTTDGVAGALVDLTAALAKAGQAEAVEIPIVFSDRDGGGVAELVVGLGNDVLSVPVEWEGDEPDYAEYEEGLRSHSVFPRDYSNVTDLGVGNEEPYDPDFEVDRA